MMTLCTVHLQQRHLKISFKSLKLTKLSCKNGMLVLGGEIRCGYAHPLPTRTAVISFSTARARNSARDVRS